MPGIAGIVFVLVFAAIVAAWTIWVVGRAEQQKEAAKQNRTDEQTASLTDT